MTNYQACNKNIRMLINTSVDKVWKKLYNKGKTL